jgi:hypothetical protein
VHDYHLEFIFFYTDNALPPYVIVTLDRKMTKYGNQVVTKILFNSIISLIV